MKRNLIAAVLLGFTSAQAGVAFAEPTLGHIDHPIVASEAKFASAPRAQEQFVATRAVSGQIEEPLYNLNP
jgi:hypothetical protein